LATLRDLFTGDFERESIDRECNQLTDKKNALIFLIVPWNIINIDIFFQTLKINQPLNHVSVKVYLRPAVSSQNRAAMGLAVMFGLSKSLSQLYLAWRPPGP
jgi:hypothetical protein